MVCFIFLFCIFSCSTLWAQKGISTNDFAQWKKCYYQQMSLWDGGLSFCIEMGKPDTEQIFLTNLCNYSYIHRLGPTNIIRCPSGVPYKQCFILESGPYCPVHPIEGVELIRPFMLVKIRTNLTYQIKTKLLQKENPSGARRFCMLRLNVDEAKEHELEIKQILMDALSDDDEIIRYIARETVGEFQKEKIPWAVDLTNTIDRIQSTNSSGGK